MDNQIEQREAQRTRREQVETIAFWSRSTAVFGFVILTSLLMFMRLDPNSAVVRLMGAIIAIDATIAIVTEVMSWRLRG